MEYLNQTSVQELGHQATVIAIKDGDLLAPVANFMKVRTVTWIAAAIPLVLLIYRLLIDRKLQSNFLVRRYHAWRYLFSGPQIIQDAFNKAGGKPFEVLAPDNRYVFVSSLKHIKELDSAPDTVLSLQAASKQMLQPVYTMTGFNWFDRRGTEGVGFVRALHPPGSQHDYQN
ncbi:hypothetical protein M7I_4623 [Glarea lozoyensis 74030]|uniref:Cytochrome P450 n=1 Tax=Glarea lozoyensis (strain ATCC 74030 / MF5533) TaxID=1104152 RepID=H0EPN8_GLAL7|nr:hypothetical protein M7I_4623 [Glarea lozoyensis 74030]